MKLLRNVKILIENRLVKKDILFNNKKILKIEDEITDEILGKFLYETTEENVEIINGEGNFATAGLIDVHVHLREPGFEKKEDIKSGTMAAAAGGFTTVMAMPNVKPFPDNLKTVEEYQRLIDEKSVVNTIPYICITENEGGRQVVDMEAFTDMGYRWFSDDGVGVQKEDIMAVAMEKAAKLGAMIVAHTEDNTYRKSYSCINEGEKSKELNLVGIPNECEYVQLERDLKIAYEKKAKYHCCHMSAKESVELIRKYKAMGGDVSGEVTAHHLVLTEESVIDSNYKMNPPLRKEEDRQELIRGIKDGTIEIIANDHAPHTEEEKNRGIVQAPFGIVALETAFPILYTKLVKSGIIDLRKLLDLMSKNPAKRFNMDKRGELREEFHSDIVLINLEKEFQIDKNKFYSKGKNTPFHNEWCFGKIVKTFVNGNLVYEEE